MNKMAKLSRKAIRRYFVLFIILLLLIAGEVLFQQETEKNGMKWQDNGVQGGVNNIGGENQLHVSGATGFLQ